MKAAELMIGDWVIRRNVPKEPMRIVELNTRKNLAYMDFTGLGIAENIEHIEPVPLTEDIIKKNGFEIKDEYIPYCHDDTRYYRRYYRIEKGNDICLEVNAGGVLLVAIYEGYTGAFESFVINALRYVHELQHALRLCGVDKEIVL